MYLVDKYAKDDSLYPKDLKRRALVNERLFFDCEVGFAIVLQIVVSNFILDFDLVLYDFYKIFTS